jgi:CTP synthase
LKDAHTTEINLKTKNPVIDIMSDQKEKLAKNDYGGTMRLGAYDCVLSEKTIAYDAYTKTKYWEIKSPSHKASSSQGKIISERHRHRYEVNPEYVDKIEKAGLIFSGKSPNGVLMEIAELPKNKHPFFLGTQFHPEFKGRPISPHPLFNEFIRAALKK